MSSAEEGTAVTNEMKLDKPQTSFNDILDSLILALSGTNLGTEKASSLVIKKSYKVLLS